MPLLHYINHSNS